MFIIPPAASLECALHKGVLIDPVDTPCGCTFCSRYAFPINERRIKNNHISVVYRTTFQSTTGVQHTH